MRGETKSAVSLMAVTHTHTHTHTQSIYTNICWTVWRESNNLVKKETSIEKTKCFINNEYNGVGIRGDP